MNHDHAHFAEWDAAYLLGALSTADRRAYEAHLDSCARCARALAEIAPTMGLLARVDPVRARSLQTATAVDDSPLVDDGARAQLLARAAREARRRRSWWIGGLAAAAALVVALVVAIGGVIASLPTADRAFALAAVEDAPLTASAELDAVRWGTRIQVECRYDGDGGADAAEGVPYTLVVLDHDGNASEVSSWRALPGATARLSAGTSLDVDDIAAIEIRLQEDDSVLMRADLDAE
ncbi:anti-sigma factor family protein [Agrococcus beijingensis]|uniref:anti-sigma factor family protein n=1 Tax=Agrococcus beijingensis TaxID=3068634 RepID=UPI0027425421|nr:zf-HC2 domain-containing protein [Agrococcus sp. REN33]